MRFHREGHTIIGTYLLTVIVLGIAFFLSTPFYIFLILLASLLVLLFFILYFFRIPDRSPYSLEDGKIISPCDGKVVVIEEVFESEILDAKCIQISVFMSPLNVHINWFPCSGQVIYKKHHKGKYLVAWHPKSSLENERTSTLIQRGNKKILVKQIAGAVARRIVNYAREGQKAERGSEMGFIKFGSRVDILIPTNSHVLTELSKKVIGGVSVLAELR